LFGAALTLALTGTAAADEARDAARSEMESALGGVPSFIDLLPDGAEAGAWALMKGSSGNPEGEIPPKYRELIALGVAAQIPCAYCTYAHTTFAKAQGATDAEIAEAIAYAAEVRLWSTILNGNQYDMAKFKDEVQAMLAQGAEASQSN
jgi:AhpD family alkylhydroperoxidase